jgi:glycosyltransferase involved in cell wall biosynthesis
MAEVAPEATLSIWGTGDESYISELRALARANEVAERVHFRGWAGPEQQRSAYAEADVVVFPVRWNEPFGLVPLEAMGVGRPVVSTLRGGTTEFVRDGQNALVFEADDHIGLARAVRRIADDPELRARLREGGRRTAQTYTITRFASDTVDEIVLAASGVRA